jgi:flagellar basal body-associated protein FliL
MAEEEATPEVEEPEASPSIRRGPFVLGAGLAVALAVAATGILVLWPDAEKGQETERAATEPAASSRAAAAAEGIDFEAELGVVLPLALVSAEGGEAGGDSHHIGKIVSLDSFVVNISDRERDRYLKLKTELELSIPELSDELDQRMPQIRDLIISLLGSKSFEEVRTIEGKNFLREEILLRVNSLLVSGKVKRVFFTEFVVQ